MVRVGSTPSPTRLIINADDFGISRGVNIGIVEAAVMEVVTSASMIVNLPAFADALDRAVLCPTLSLGLHLRQQDLVRECGGCVIGRRIDRPRT